MRYTIYRKVFTCENGEEYRAIDGFWDEMASLYGRDNLFGIAYHWSNGTLHYGIGHKTKDISRNRYMSGFLRGCKLVEIEIPDDGWEVHKLDSVEGDQLEKFYEQIWKEGCLDCEMEELYESGGATISLHYERKKRRQV